LLFYGAGGKIPHDTKRTSGRLPEKEEERRMKYLRECLIIFGLTFAGEVLNRILPLPVPAGVYGLFLMLVLLCTGLLKLEQVEATGNFLLDIMPVMFIPASVGLLESMGVLQAILVPVVVISLASTVIVMAATGIVAEKMLGGKKHEPGK